MLITPRHRRGPLLYPIEFEVNGDGWPAVLIVAGHAGFGPWFMGLFNRAPKSRLELGATMMVCHNGGVFRGRTPPVDLADIDNAYPERRHPKYHIQALFVAGFLMLVYFKVG